MKKELVANLQNAMEKELEIRYSLKSVYSQGFFKRLEKVGNKALLNDIVETWLDGVDKETVFTNKTVLETIHEITVAFLEIAIKDKKNVVKVLVPIGDDFDFFFGYELDKNKSVLKFNIYEKK